MLQSSINMGRGAGGEAAGGMDRPQSKYMYEKAKIIQKGWQNEIILAIQCKL